MKKAINKGLYLVLSKEYASDGNFLSIAESAVAGGIDVLQMREKNLSREDLIGLGSVLSLLCMRGGVKFIVNDDPEIAKEVNADGVHLGQEDIKKWPIDKVRKMLGENKTIGISTHSADQFRTAEDSDCDYIAFGPVFKTKTKDYCIGTEEIKEVASSSKKPVVFIGGIDLDNVDEVIKSGGKNIAVIRAIMQAEDVEGTVKIFKDRINNDQR